MAIKVMGKKNISNRELARKFGIDESTIRYHLARAGSQFTFTSFLGSSPKLVLSPSTSSG